MQATSLTMRFMASRCPYRHNWRRRARTSKCGGSICSVHARNGLTMRTPPNTAPGCRSSL